MQKEQAYFYKPPSTSYKKNPETYCTPCVNTSHAHVLPLGQRQLLPPATHVARVLGTRLSDVWQTGKITLQFKPVLWMKRAHQPLALKTALACELVVHSGPQASSLPSPVLASFSHIVYYDL